MQTYLVGGAVRDQLLGHEPKDKDWVIVGADAGDIADMEAHGYQQVGADFPVYLHPVTGDEYALARVERKIGEGYHGFEVDANSAVTIEDDLARRDLTINSMAIGEDGVLIDPFKGRCDLRNCVLRHTTAAFSEDPLRVLRLARFAARFNQWSIAPETVALCNSLCDSGELNALTVERVWVELEKGFSEKHPLQFMVTLDKLGALRACKLLTEIFGADFLLDENRAAIAAALKNVPAEQRLAVAVGTLASSNSALPGASARARDCFSNVQFAGKTERTSAGLLQLLKKAKAFSEGNAFRDLIAAMMASEYAGVRSAFPARKVELAARISMDVRASHFDPALQGKELGQAIEETRIANIQMALSIPNVNGQRQQG